MGKKKSNFRQGFRKNKRIKHPTYVVGEVGNIYKYIGITHSESFNGVKNIPLKRNPNPSDARKSYIRPCVEEDIPKNFGRRLKGWSFSDEDKKTVKRVIEKSKKPHK